MTEYLPRTAWNARPPTSSRPLSAPDVEGIGVHWPGMAKPLFTLSAVASALRGWQDYHMDVRGWSDIAYQVAVDQAGRAWTLRGLTTRSAANGDVDTNTRFGAVLLVLAPGEDPSRAMVQTVRSVIADFRVRYPAGTRIEPHSAIRPTPTDCPGDIARSYIARGVFKPIPLPTEDDMTPNDLLNAELIRPLPDGTTRNFGSVGGVLATLMLRTADDDARTNALADQLARVEEKLDALAP